MERLSELLESKKVGRASYLDIGEIKAKTSKRDCQVCETKTKQKALFADDDEVKGFNDGGMEPVWGCTVCGTLYKRRQRKRRPPTRRSFDDIMKDLLGEGPR